MDDGSKILVISTVPTVGYMLINGLVQVGVFLICAIVAYYLLKQAGFNVLAYLRGEEQQEQEKKDAKKSETKAANPSSKSQAE